MIFLTVLGGTVAASLGFGAAAYLWKFWFKKSGGELWGFFCWLMSVGAVAGFVAQIIVWSA